MKHLSIFFLFSVDNVDNFVQNPFFRCLIVDNFAMFHVMRWSVFSSVYSFCACCYFWGWRGFLGIIYHCFWGEKALYRINGAFHVTQPKNPSKNINYDILERVYSLVLFIHQLEDSSYSYDVLVCDW